MKTRITALSTVALLALTACGNGDSDTEPAPEPVEATEAAQDSQEGDTEPAVEETGDDDTDNLIEVGDSFQLADSSGEGAEVTVHYEAFAWIEPGYVGGEENYGVAIFTVDNTEGDSPVRLLAPIDGGGWSYLQEDGTINSLYNLTSDWSSTYSGRVQNMHSGPYSPGTREADMYEDVIVPERGGTLVYTWPDGSISVELEVPDESVNEDHESIQEIYQIADSMFEGEVASGPDRSAPGGNDDTVEDAPDSSTETGGTTEGAVDCEEWDARWGGLMNDEIAGIEVDEVELAEIELWLQENGCW